MYKILYLPQVAIVFVTLFINDIALNGQDFISNSNYVQANQYFESLKRPDHELINGRLLMPSRLKTYGHPYLGEDMFLIGNLTINNSKFADIPMKYDILDQKVVIEFSYEGMVKRPLILNNEFIQSFTLNGKQFIKKELPGMEERYLQEIAGDSIYCYYYFYKREEEKSEGPVLVRQIHPTKLSRYLKISNEYFSFRSRRTFFRIFNKNDKLLIKKYMKSNKINMKSISDEEMRALLSFCENQLYNK